MPIFELTKDITFPDPELADPSGIIAIGGDLQPGRLLQAYRMGIFPWFNEYDPLVWWSPDPRTVLYPAEVKISHSMRKILRDKVFRVTFDNNFEAVIKCCREQKRPGQRGTWITEDILKAYVRLHHLGYAHSVEVWKDEDLAGGLYGVSLGRMFAGESMFSRVSNASKTGLIVLAKKLEALGYILIDCQLQTRHLASLGAREISRRQYMRQLAKSLEQPTLRGNWGRIQAFQQESVSSESGKPAPSAARFSPCRQNQPL